MRRVSLSARDPKDRRPDSNPAKRDSLKLRRGLYCRNAHLGLIAALRIVQLVGLDTRTGERSVYLETKFEGGLIVRLLSLIDSQGSARRIGFCISIEAGDMSESSKRNLRSATPTRGAEANDSLMNLP